MSTDKKQLYRVIDANFNRAKEGLRVCEDVCRFVLNQTAATKKYKDIRHNLTGIIGSLTLKKIVEARNITGDVGRVTTDSELKRKKVSDIFYANSQRVKESIRVLEEFAKILNTRQSQKLKTIRYECYELERKIIKLL